jgi:NAD(P)-dependent dehydrogenase (short-subunit alcohol dehydrogenase family)
MINNGWGRILLFGGTNTSQIRGFSSTAAYSAAKTALGVLAKSVAKTAGKSGVACNVICPGLTDTEYTALEEREFNRKKSGGKALTPGEVAQTALDVLESPVLNGAVIPVDRGVWV